MSAVLGKFALGLSFSAQMKDETGLFAQAKNSSLPVKRSDVQNNNTASDKDAKIYF
jgi:hypothetical protein